MTFDAYHATDRKNLNTILNTNFTYRQNNEHWLGNGVYFFLDPALADDWCEKQKKSYQYGHIKNGIIIHVLIHVDGNDLLDLRQLDEYNYVRRNFEKFISKLRTMNINIEEMRPKQLVCSFFDMLQASEHIKCFIANFNERSNSLPKSLKKQTEALWTQFNMPFVETQVCLFDVSCITLKEEFQYEAKYKEV